MRKFIGAKHLGNPGRGAFAPIFRASNSLISHWSAIKDLLDPNGISDHFLLEGRMPRKGVGTKEQRECAKEMKQKLADTPWNFCMYFGDTPLIGDIIPNKLTGIVDYRFRGGRPNEHLRLDECLKTTAERSEASTEWLKLFATQQIPLLTVPVSYRDACKTEDIKLNRVLSPVFVHRGDAEPTDINSNYGIDDLKQGFHLRFVRTPEDVSFVPLKDGSYAMTKRPGHLPDAVCISEILDSLDLVKETKKVLPF